MRDGDLEYLKKYLDADKLDEGKEEGLKRMRMKEGA